VTLFLILRIGLVTLDVELGFLVREEILVAVWIFDVLRFLGVEYQDSVSERVVTNNLYVGKSRD